MTEHQPALENLKDAWQVLTLFLIPIGGGIPAGVLLARTRAIAWPVTMALYFISDVILAIVFEPLLLLILHLTRKSKRAGHAAAVFKQALNKTISRYGVNPGPFTLIVIALGADPMTGRAASRAAGHGFISGWALAIAGDMIYFTLIMASTLWLNNILGDGTWTTVIILAAMIAIPYFLRAFRKNPDNRGLT